MCFYLRTVRDSPVSRECCGVHTRVKMAFLQADPDLPSAAEHVVSSDVSSLPVWADDVEPSAGGGLLADITILYRGEQWLLGNINWFWLYRCEKWLLGNINCFWLYRGEKWLLGNINCLWL